MTLIPLFLQRSTSSQTAGDGIQIYCRAVKDADLCMRLARTVAELRDGGCEVFISTHMIDSVDTFWDRTIIMQKGQIRANVTRRELEERGESLEELFFAITEETPEKPDGETLPEQPSERN